MRKHSSKEGVVIALMEQYGVSRKQSYRYIQKAQKTKHKLPIPEGKTVFTDKLPISLVSCIREHATLQIVESSRRGKRHRARSGLINVLSGAPYGYRYVKNTEDSAAYYELVEEEAEPYEMSIAGTRKRD